MKYRRPEEQLLAEALSVIGYARQTLRLRQGKEEAVAKHLSSEYLRLLEGLRKPLPTLGYTLSKAQSTPIHKLLKKP